MNRTSTGGVDLRKSPRGVIKDPWRKRVRLFIEDRRWVIIGLLCLTAFVLGYIGDRRLLAGAAIRHSPVEPIYRSLQLFFFDDSAIEDLGSLPWQLEVARLLAPLTTALTAGTAVITLFREQFQRLRLKFMKDHVVVCGLGQTGLQLVRDFHLSRENVVAIEIEQTRSGVSSCRDEGVPVLIGDATEAFMLRKASVDRARYLIAVCGEDGINVETALQAQRQRESAKREGLQCFIHLTCAEFAALVRQSGSHASAQSQLKFFNIAENSARALLQEYPPDCPATPHTQSDRHVVIVGFGDMGEKLLLQLAKIGHYASGEKLRITVVAKGADEREKVLRLRYPQLDQVCNVRFLSLDIPDPEFIAGRFLSDSVTNLYICQDSDSRALVSLLTLIPRLEKVAEVVVCMRQREGLAGLLNRDDEHRRPSINVFAIIESASTREIVLHESLDILAKAIHSTYLERHSPEADKRGTVTYAVDWNLLPEEIKDSNRQQADHIPVKLRAIRCHTGPASSSEADRPEFTPKEVELLARMEHSRWRAERLLSGWTHSPAAEDTNERVSPHLIQWNDLPADAKEYNRQVVREIPAILAQIGLVVIRTT